MASATAQSTKPEAREPSWLVDRRARAVEAAKGLTLPGPKTRGWEFTDLSKLDLSAYAPAEGGDLANVEIASARLQVPAGSAGLTQVDATTHLDDASPPMPASAGRPESVTVMSLSEGAEAEVWERYVSADEATAGLFNGVTELILGAGSNLRYVCGQDLSSKSWVFASQRAEVERDATLEWIALGFGSASGKVRMETKLSGRGANARVTGAYVSNGRQHLDYDTTQEHAAEDTTSDLSFRGVLDGRSTAVWRGMINVDPGAQRTDAFQDCRNLLLSKRAHADAIPGLQIEADDVACTHAAAIAQIDPEQLFYLTSRGLDAEQAGELIVGGFLAELVERIPAGPVADALAAALEGRLRELLDG